MFGKRKVIAGARESVSKVMSKVEVKRIVGQKVDVVESEESKMDSAC